jgi:hypothetical protein
MDERTLEEVLRCQRCGGSDLLVSMGREKPVAVCQCQDENCSWVGSIPLTPAQVDEHWRMAEAGKASSQIRRSPTPDEAISQMMEALSPGRLLVSDLIGP